jgi:hypothetical protein
MRTGFGGTLSHKRGLITGVSAIALAAAISMAVPSGAMAANCTNALNLNVINPIVAPGASGQNNGTGALATCLGNTVSGHKLVEQQRQCYCWRDSK